MTNTAKPNRVVQISALTLVLIASIPLFINATKIATEYARLKDVRFQSERLLTQEQQATQTLDTTQAYADALNVDFTHLAGAHAQAYRALQTQLQSLVSETGGALENISSVPNSQENEDVLKPVTASIRWSGSEVELGLFLAHISKPNQNLKLGTLNIRRRQGVTNSVELQVQISALWQEGK